MSNNLIIINLMDFISFPSGVPLQALSFHLYYWESKKPSYLWHRSSLSTQSEKSIRHLRKILLKCDWSQPLPWKNPGKWSGTDFFHQNSGELCVHCRFYGKTQWKHQHQEQAKKETNSTLEVNKRCPISALLWIYEVCLEVDTPLPLRTSKISSINSSLAPNIF